MNTKYIRQYVGFLESIGSVGGNKAIILLVCVTIYGILNRNATQKQILQQVYKIEDKTESTFCRCCKKKPTSDVKNNNANAPNKSCATRPKSPRSPINCGLRISHLSLAHCPLALASGLEHFASEFRDDAARECAL